MESLLGVGAGECVTAVRMSAPHSNLLRGCVLLASVAAWPAAAADVMSLRIEDLMEIGVVGASKYEQPLKTVAAAASVITRQEIRAHVVDQLKSVVHLEALCIRRWRIFMMLRIWQIDHRRLATRFAIQQYFKAMRMIVVMHAHYFRT